MVFISMRWKVLLRHLVKISDAARNSDVEVLGAKVADDDCLTVRNLKPDQQRSASG